MVSSLYRTDKIEPLGEAREILNFARAQARKQAPNLQHPHVCIDVIEEGIVSGPHAGILKESDAFQVLLKTDICKSLVHLFFAQCGTRGHGSWFETKTNKNGCYCWRRSDGVRNSNGLILNGYQVFLKEVNQKFLDAGLGRVKVNLTSSVKKGKLTKEKFEKTISRITGVLDYESFKDVDMVIEQMEFNDSLYMFKQTGCCDNVSLKQEIFSDLEKYCSPNCILVSNTSTIDLNLIGEKTKSHDRIIGAHFFRPGSRYATFGNRPDDETSPQTVVDLLDVAKKIRKTPVVVGNRTGFAVNRMFFPYTQAALLLVERGAGVYNIDRAITKFGMPMGPFRLCDHVGFVVAVASGTQFVYSFPERTYKSMLIPLMQEDKRAGETTRKGFYLYNDKCKASPDREIKKYIKKAREISGISVEPELRKLSDNDIIEMVFFPVVNEACRVYAEGIAVKAADLDIAGVMGMGFPPYRFHVFPQQFYLELYNKIIILRFNIRFVYRGGIMFWGDSVGSKYIYERLNEWSKLYGDFFKPCDYLAQRAALGAPLVRFS
ncbi:putative isomerase, 3-hydroxyacyl-CoA dehydrogenase, Enoyl-CoA hydratase [Helianthus annuus]|nr:putative isomerase, 3-hydroxyacyl-CoA dehydrogenase, Enoyl-CoA hydratase [Helianthus annuus]